MKPYAKRFVLLGIGLCSVFLLSKLLLFDARGPNPTEQLVERVQARVQEKASSMPVFAEITDLVHLAFPDLEPESVDADFGDRFVSVLRGRTGRCQYEVYSIDGTPRTLLSWLRPVSTVILLRFESCADGPTYLEATAEHYGL